MVGSSSGWTEARRDEGAARRELTGSRKQRTVQGCLRSNISAQQELRPQRAPPSERRRFLFLWARTGTALPAAAPEWQADRRQCHSCRRWSHKSRKATGAVFAAAGAVSASFVRRLSARPFGGSGCGSRHRASWHDLCLTQFIRRSAAAKSNY